MKTSSSNCFRFFTALVLATISSRTAQFIDAEGGLPRPEMVRPAPARPKNVAAENGLFARSLNGLYVATAAKDGRIRGMRAVDGATFYTFYLCSPTTLAFSADGSTLIAVGGAENKQTIRMWRLPDGKRIDLLVNRSPEPIGQTALPKALAHRLVDPNGRSVTFAKLS